MNIKTEAVICFCLPFLVVLGIGILFKLADIARILEHIK